MSKEQNGEMTGSRPEADFAEVQLQSPYQTQTAALTAIVGYEGASTRRTNRGRPGRSP